LNAATFHSLVDASGDVRSTEGSELNRALEGWLSDRLHGRPLDQPILEQSLAAATSQAGCPSPEQGSMS